ncbi:MAG: DUF348 domain-containing protein [Eubacteriaceae bacterium]|nr:DUF348 domain-containing protein [Eubacteriaceae bacterium]
MINNITAMKDFYHKNRKLIWISLAVLTLIAAFLIFQLTEKLVTIVEGDQIIEYKFHGEKNVKEVLLEKGIYLGDNDRISISLSKNLKDKEKILVSRGMQVKLVADNKEYVFETPDREVKKIVEELGLEIGELDIVSPEADTVLKDESQDPIKITRVKEEIVENKQIVKYNKVIRNNGELDKGIVKKVQSGRDGLRTVAEKVVYHDGKEVERIVLEEKTVAEPVDEIEEVGTNVFIATSRGTVRFQNTMYVTATGYCSCSICTGAGDGTITASGTRTTAGRTIAASSRYSFGTEFFIPGLSGRTFVVEDRGSAISGNKIDIYFATHAEALRFGRQTLKVYVLE